MTYLSTGLLRDGGREGVRGAESESTTQESTQHLRGSGGGAKGSGDGAQGAVLTGGGPGSATGSAWRC